MLVVFVLPVLIYFLLSEFSLKLPTRLHESVANLSYRLEELEGQCRSQLPDGTRTLCILLLARQQFNNQREGGVCPHDSGVRRGKGTTGKIKKGDDE